MIPNITEMHYKSGKLLPLQVQSAAAVTHLIKDCHD